MSEGKEKQPIVVVDSDLTSRNLAEDLEDELDTQVIAMDSTEFDIDASEDILTSRAVIVSWDLGIRSGADLLEEIRIHEGIAAKTVLIATEEPTASLVRLAMRLGADGICRKPYEADEIRARLAAVEGRSAEEAA